MHPKSEQTWQYVNVKGGPDRCYANNPVLPIMLYGALDLTSPQGLNWQLQTPAPTPPRRRPVRWELPT